MKEVISKNEKDFVLSSIEKLQRIDGRRVNDMRAIKIEFGKSYGVVEVQLGKTRYVFFIKIKIKIILLIYLYKILKIIIIIIIYVEFLQQLHVI